MNRRGTVFCAWGWAGFLCVHHLLPKALAGHSHVGEETAQTRQVWWEFRLKTASLELGVGPALGGQELVYGDTDSLFLSLHSHFSIRSMGSIGGQLCSIDGFGGLGTP